MAITWQKLRTSQRVYDALELDIGRNKTITYEGRKMVVFDRLKVGRDKIHLMGRWEKQRGRIHIVVFIQDGLGQVVCRKQFGMGRKAFEGFTLPDIMIIAASSIMQSRLDDEANDDLLPVDLLLMESKGGANQRVWF